MTREAGTLRVGTSGWSYDHWAGALYPEGLPARRRLEYYAERFATVEVDATFYRLPSERAVEAWRDAVPDDFIFAVKGSRYITHYRRLADGGAGARTFLDRLRLLGAKLGVVLWQLPPTLARDDALLAGFLEGLPRGGTRHAIEFRHESWLDENVYARLRSQDVAMVNVSGEMLRADLTPTASFAYARFHGTSHYHGAYDRPALEPWAAFLRERLASGCDCYAYFNNDFEGHAPRDASRLVEMLARDDAAPEPERRRGR